jgi:hypothetical protein
MQHTRCPSNELGRTPGTDIFNYTCFLRILSILRFRIQMRSSRSPLTLQRQDLRRIEVVRPGRQPGRAAGLPQLAIECGERDRLAQRFLPHQRGRQVHRVVAARSLHQFSVCVHQITQRLQTDRPYLPVRVDKQLPPGYHRASREESRCAPDGSRVRAADPIPCNVATLQPLILLRRCGPASFACPPDSARTAQSKN